MPEIVKPPQIVPNLSGTVINYLVRRGSTTLARYDTREEAEAFVAALIAPDAPTTKPKAKRTRKKK